MSSQSMCHATRLLARDAVFLIVAMREHGAATVATLRLGVAARIAADHLGAGDVRALARPLLRVELELILADRDAATAVAAVAARVDEHAVGVAGARARDV